MNTIKKALIAGGLCVASYSAVAAEVKNVILMIGDGMGPQQVGMLETYAQKAPHSIYQGSQRHCIDWHKMASSARH